MWGEHLDFSFICGFQPFSGVGTAGGAAAGPRVCACRLPTLRLSHRPSANSAASVSPLLAV